VGLELGSLSLVSKIEELLERKNSCSCLENREYGRRRSAALIIRQMLALTSLTSVGRSVGIVHSRTKSTEVSFLVSLLLRVSSRNN
jgi:hypothetical protein